MLEVVGLLAIVVVAGVFLYVAHTVLKDVNKGFKDELHRLDEKQRDRELLRQWYEAKQEIRRRLDDSWIRAIGPAPKDGSLPPFEVHGPLGSKYAAAARPVPTRQHSKSWKHWRRYGGFVKVKGETYQVLMDQDGHPSALLHHNMMRRIYDEAQP